MCSFEADYVVRKELGKGGFGLVYHVLHKLTNYDYAVKIVKLPHRLEEWSSCAMSI